MFDYVIASLSPEVATEVRDLILTPPGENQYNALKEQLIQRTAASQQQRLQQLLGAEELGDRRPSQFLRRLQQLAGDAVRTDGAFLHELFLQRLPSNVRMVLAAANDTVPISELAKLANRIMEVATPSLQRRLAPASQQLAPCLTLSNWRSYVLKEVKSLRHSTCEHSPRRRSPSPVPDSSGMCWYHKKFGFSAQKCRAPCSYSGNALAGH